MKNKRKIIIGWSRVLLMSLVIAFAVTVGLQECITTAETTAEIYSWTDWTFDGFCGFAKDLLEFGMIAGMIQNGIKILIIRIRETVKTYLA